MQLHVPQTLIKRHLRIPKKTGKAALTRSIQESTISKNNWVESTASKLVLLWELKSHSHSFARLSNINTSLCPSLKSSWGGVDSFAFIISCQGASIEKTLWVTIKFEPQISRQPHTLLRSVDYFRKSLKYPQQRGLPCDWLHSSHAPVSPFPLVLKRVLFLLQSLTSASLLVSASLHQFLSWMMENKEVKKTNEERENL